MNRVRYKMVKYGAELLVLAATLGVVVAVSTWAVS